MTDKEAVCVGVRLRPFVAYESGQEQLEAQSDCAVRFDPAHFLARPSNIRCLTIEDNMVHVDPMLAEQSQKAKAGKW